MPTTGKAQCPECSRPITVHVGDAEYLNGASASVVVVPHIKRTKCDCGREFVPHIGIADLKITGLIEVAPVSSIIAPGMTLPKI